MDMRLLAPEGLRDQYSLLADTLGAVTPAGSRILDIGAGRGADQYHPLVSEMAGELVGVDPDPVVSTNPFLDTAIVGRVHDLDHRFDGYFDTALAVYVIEHVADPGAFLSAVHGSLRPGGAFVAVTPHLLHYFGLSARAAAALHAEDVLLRRLRGAELTDHYHHPVHYRLNTVGALARHGADAGFESCAVTMLEDPGVFEPYFPGRLRAFPRGYATLVHRLGLTRARGTIIVTLHKPA